MRYAALVFLFLLAVAGTANADEYTPYADLVCDPARNMALARFIEADDPDPPHYARLPAGIDNGLSAKPGTGHRVCVLANGWEIKLRNGVGQAFAYGQGGAAPPYFFSLWVDHRKVFSKVNWSEQNYAEEQPQIAGMVITPTQVTTCAWKDGREKPLTCTAKPLDMTRYKIDAKEYPPDNWRDDPAELVVTHGTDDEVCHAIIQHGPNSQGVVRDGAGEPDLPVPEKKLAWIDILGHPPREWSSVSDMKAVFGLAAEDMLVHFAPEAGDFDGDGVPDTVIERESSNHYFDGSYFVVAPGKTPVTDVLRALYSGKDEDVEKDVERAQALGWHVYAGGRPGLYPNVSPRYVHIDRIWYVQDYLIAYPLNEDEDPTAIVIKPRPDGKFDTVCTIQRPRLNY